MKTVVYERYGGPDVLKLKETEKPKPKDDEILIKVAASSINSADHRMMRAKPFFVRFMGGGVFKPKQPILGIDIAGKVEAVGKDVTGFKSGDEVFGDIYSSGTGAFAEYVCAKADSPIVKKPKKVSFEQAASVPVAGITALQALRDNADLKAGQSVLVNGASGGVGTFTVLIAKAMGAKVTGVCSTRNLDIVHTAGAEEVIDYSKQDIVKSGKRFDVIIDNAGTLSAADMSALLNPGGKGILVGFSSMFHMMRTASKGKKISKKNDLTIKPMGMAQANKADLEELAKMIAGGEIKPVIDKVYPIEQTAAAMRYFDEVHARAKVIITMTDRG